MPPLNDNDFTAYGDDDFQVPCRPGTVTVHDSNVGATKQVGEPNFDGTVGGHSVWWWWTSPGNGTVTIQAHPDYVNGTPLTNPLLLVYDCDVDCDYDHPVAQGHGSVTFTAKQNVDYIIGIDGAAGQEGDFALTLARPSSPANDLQALAEVLPGDSGSTNGATNWACTEEDDPAGFFNVWYKWTPSVAGWAKLTQTLTDALPGGRQVVVYAGGPGAWTAIVERDFATPGDALAGSVWDLFFPVEAGTTYHVLVSGEGAGLDRFTLDWFAAMDLSDVTPADIVVGPAVSTNTVTVQESTPGGTWFRFELEHVSGTLPTHDGTAPGYLGLIELEDDTGAVCCQVRLAGDLLQARDPADAWFNLGKPSTIGPGLSKVRLEIYSRKLDDGTSLNSYFRVNGVPVGSVAGSSAPTARYVKTVRYGCLWNGGGDAVQVRIKNIGIRVDPDLGPWCSTDAADKGVTFLWGGEGGEFGLSSGGTDWITKSDLTGIPPAVIPAPGAGPSPGGRYGNALDCSTGGTAIVRAVSVPLGFSMRVPESLYFYASDYPDSTGTIVRVWDGDGSHTIDVRLDPTGALQVFMQGLQVGTIRHVSLNRWHHLELHVDALSPRWPTKVRLNGVDFGPFTFTPFGIPSVTRRFVPGALVAGNVSGVLNFGLAIKDLTVYRQTAYPLGGQTIRKRVPDGVGSHDANVDEWVAGANQQTPVTDGDAVFDYSGYAVGSYDPPDWLHNLHFQNTVSPDDPLHKIKVQLATLSPPAGVSGEKVLSYLSSAGVSSGAYTPIPPPAVASPHRYLVEAWIYKAAGGDGTFSSEAFPVFLQSWPWHDVVAAGYGGWFKFSEDAFQISGFTASEFGFKHSDASSFLYQVGAITIWEDYVYEPRATGFWQSDDDGATYTSIQDADTSSHGKIQEWPPAAGGKVIGVGPATPGWDTPASPAGNADHHLEYTLQDNTSVGAPIMAARFYVRGRGYDWRNRHTDPTDGSIVYPSRASVESGAHGSPILYVQDVSGAERRWMPGLFVSRGGLAVGARGHDSYMLPTAAGDAAWTPSLWNALRARLGFPVALANPNGIVAEPVVEACAFEVLVPEPELPPEGGGPILAFSFRADPQTTPPASPTTEANAHLAGIEFRA